MPETDDNPAPPEPAEGGGESVHAPSQSGRDAISSGAAGERLVAEHADAVWRFVLSRVRSADTAEDVVQETFLAAVQSLGSFSGESAERTWLLGIASHKVSDYFRRRARRQHREPDGRGEDQACTCEACRALFTGAGMWARTPGDWEMGQTPSEKSAARDALRGCVDDLPAAQREAMWLRDVLGVPTAEVCKALGLTATNLWTRLHRARSAVRTCLERKLGRSGRATGGASDRKMDRQDNRGGSS